MPGNTSIFFGGVADDLEVRSANLQPCVRLAGRDRGKGEQAQNWQGPAEHKWAPYRYTVGGEASKGVLDRHGERSVD